MCGCRGARRAAPCGRRWRRRAGAAISSGSAAAPPAPAGACPSIPLRTLRMA